MKVSIFLAAVALACFAQTAAAGPVEAACNRSDRKAANRALCQCIGQVAGRTLRAADQRRAASFFTKPEKAHRAWMSKNASDDAFWERYKNFGAAAAQTCASGG